MPGWPAGIIATGLIAGMELKYLQKSGKGGAGYLNIM